ncbi:MAG: ATPase superfamily-like protein, partial [Acidobacteria bacterium]|nr:ATPase superfamily-like protein [Acidobacteriota bacterium]
MFQKGSPRLVEPARRKCLFIFAVDLRLKSEILRTPLIQKRPQLLVYRPAFHHPDNSLFDRGFSRYNTGMIQRKALFQSIKKALKRNRAVALIGPRQCGKTTLARQFLSPESKNYFDLENPFSLARLDQPMVALENLKGLIVIDEIQRRPELFPVLRVLCDRKPLPARFLILGSASPELLRQSSESLAGRLAIIYMGGFSLDEVGFRFQAQHWQRGGFPLSFLASSDEESFAWRKDFVSTFLERDIPQFGFSIPATSLFRFWSMLAHYHGQIWNNSEAARSLNISEGTARRYVDLLQDLFMVRQLQPWHANLGKRQIKSPKIYFRDTGLLHYLLGIRAEHELAVHPRNGASWEGYVIEETLRAGEPEQAYFWATHAGAELDLLLIKNG